ncbi:MAG TPA: DsbE family thiol:disulfide interchange protein [Steroidobacteraceae bacterium]|nr:DsbE family thiol:disulfide interchange protein [Steroidobacteraceae bacterium]
MRIPLRFLVPTLGFAILVGFFVVGLKRDPGVLPSPLIGKPAPEFTLESLGDPAWKLSPADFRGRHWVFNVWATWCVGCRQEHETLLAIAREDRVPIVGLNWRDDRALALRWLGQLGNPYAAVAFDPEGRTAIDWGVYGAPETFLMDARGIVVWKHIGPMTLDAWRRDFVPRLPAPESTP